MNKKQYPIPATIVIRLNGDETTATILGDEFKISGITRTHAKRNPKDEYDAYIGARVALDRLFGKDFFEEHQEDDEPKKAKEEPKPRWKTGDKVVAVNVPILENFLGMVGTVTNVKYDASLEYFEYEAEFGPKRIKQWWSEFGGEKVQSVRAATAEDLVEKEPKKAAEPEKAETPKGETEFQVGDIVRITNPIHVIPFLEPYERGDVAVITEVNQTPIGAGYAVKIRSKERKGKLALVVGDELTLLHRAKGAEQA